MSARAVEIAMGLITASIIAFDVWLALDGVEANTISARIRAWGRAFPATRILWCVSIGVLLGHFFWT